MIDTWEKIIDPNFINAELIGPVGAERVVTIKDIDYAEAFNQKTNSKEQRQSLFFNECKPMILNKTNSKKLRELFDPEGKDPRKCVGQKITLYVISCKVGKVQTTGIRIKEASQEKCADCGQTIKATSTKTVAELVDISMRNCGRKLCLACMQKEAAKRAKEETKNE